MVHWYYGTLVLWYCGTMRIAHVLASFLGEAAIQTLDMQRWSNGERLDMRENSVKTAEGSREQLLNAQNIWR